MVFTRVVFLMVLSFVCIECVVLTGKAFFCRDPDTGKLHAVNTTWPSASFCGNYTCKLRIKNVTQIEYTPLRQLNITNIQNLRDHNKTVNFHTKTQPDIITILHKKPHTDNTNKKINSVELELMKIEKKVMTSLRRDNLESHDYINDRVSYEQMKRFNNAKPQAIVPSSQEYQKLNREASIDTKDSNKHIDRYLTEKEIDKIADALHTVKKSDLDAIVDIYNLAEEIYNEMDERVPDDKNMVGETINMIKHDQSRRHNKPISYWYDPLTNKVRDVDKFDLNLAGAKNAPTIAPAKITPPQFNRKLSSKEFYYPVSNFQRLSSYTHVPSNAAVIANRDKVREQKRLKNIAKEPKPCDKSKQKHVYKEEDYRRVIQPSYLLPYPFTYVHHYNITDIPTFYYNSPSWKLDYYNRYRYYQPYYNAFIAQVPTVINTPSEEVQDIEVSPVKIETSKVKNLELSPINQNALRMPQEKRPSFVPEWKTGPIPQEDLESVRAKIDTGRIIKAFPLRKLVKLDKVGTLNKIDGDKSDVRLKRSPYKMSVPEVETNYKEHEEYEAYLDRITCKTQTVPGYFRMGNLSQPFPYCCPQLIHTLSTLNNIVP